MEIVLAFSYLCYNFAKLENQFKPNPLHLPWPGQALERIWYRSNLKPVAQSGLHSLLAQPWLGLIPLLVLCEHQVKGPIETE